MLEHHHPRAIIQADSSIWRLRRSRLQGSQRDGRRKHEHFPVADPQCPDSLSLRRRCSRDLVVCRFHVNPFTGPGIYPDRSNSPPCCGTRRESQQGDSRTGGALLFSITPVQSRCPRTTIPHGSGPAPENQGPDLRRVTLRHAALATGSRPETR